MKNYRGATHLMIDLETLGTGPNAVVLEIGVVRFVTHADGGMRFLGEGSVALSVREQIMYKRHIDPDTVAWWHNQEAAARRALLAKEETPVYKALQDVVDFISEGGEFDYIWCQGASFDFPVLRSLLEDYQMAVPWGFWQERDSCTVIKGTDIDKSGVVGYGPAHSAVADCKRQAEALARAIWFRG